MEHLVVPMLEHAAPIVPRQVERVRRISQLLRNPLVFGIVWIQLAVDQGRVLLGIRESTALAALLIAFAALLFVALPLRRRARELGVARVSAPFFQWPPAVFFLLVAGVMAVALVPLLGEQPRRPLSGALISVLVIPGLAYMAVGWWRHPWWPRLALTLAYGAAFALLPLWLPAAGGRLAAVLVMMYGFAAAANVVDQCELLKLLREAEQVAEGDVA